VARKLDDYRDKRDPARTNEPFGPEPMHSARATQAGRFVVHCHAATRLHYDLRLEVSGVLKSFAVPRGPSLDPADKRLAMHTEDHPIEYLHFEAVIPAGNYGAGAMILWDCGGVHYLEQSAELGLASGKLDFVLSGFKLRGRFALVRTGRRDQPDQRQWLLLKKPDPHIKPGRDVGEDEPHSVLSGLTVEQLGRRSEHALALVTQADALGARGALGSAQDLLPMRCAEDGGRLDDPNSLYELKLDGVRLLAERAGDRVALRYRTGRNVTASYPELVRALRALAPEQVILDGEVVAFDERGRPSFARLAERLHVQGERELFMAQYRVPVVYVVFDVLAIGERDLRKLPLHARKQLLSQLLHGRGYLRLLDAIQGGGRALMDFCEAQRLEGVVAKRADSPYVPGPQRSSHWVKLKRTETDDFVVVGYTQGKGNRAALGALELASYRAAPAAHGDRADRAPASELVTRGRVGSGLSGAEVDRLHEQLRGSERARCAAVGALLPAPEGRTFVAPRLVVSVEHSGFTAEGRLRHPVYRGLRSDVAPSECRAAPHEEREAALLESVAQPSATDAGAGAGAGRAGHVDAAPQRSAPAQRGPAARTRVLLTNRSKVFWPNEGITKGELLDYYDAVSEQLLPYLRERPVLMVRYPDGIEGKSFYQWNVPKGTPDWIETQTLPSAEYNRDVTFFHIRDRDTLLYIINLGCIPLHVLAARFGQLDRCDFLTIDFDLGESTLEHAITLARTLHGLLSELGLPGFPKTSGQTGLHVLVPLGGVAFGAATSLASLLGHLLHVRHPELSTLERTRAKRPKKVVFIDTGQTGHARAIVSPYSVRAHAGATVSTPLRWDEVGPGLAPARFDIRSVRERLTETADPMRELLTITPDVHGALARLESLIGAQRPRR
jgi:bifunctional non-homologous end joining protein LigD